MTAMYVQSLLSTSDNCSQLLAVMIYTVDLFLTTYSKFKSFPCNSPKKAFPVSSSFFFFLMAVSLE